MTSKKTVLLLGGSFNPIHEDGHVKMPKFVYDALNSSGVHIDETWLMPAAQNPHKGETGMAEFKHRYEMCKLQADSYGDWLKVTDFEGTVDPPYYSYSVLLRLLKKYPNYQFIWLMGSDNLVTFHKWENWHDILELLPVIVVGRKGSCDASLNSITMERYAHALNEIHDPLDKLPNIRFLGLSNFGGSATDIRNAIFNGKQTPELHTSVRAYIDAHMLYR